MSTLNRFLSFFGRGLKTNQSNHIQTAVLTDQESELEGSEVWSTHDYHGHEDHKRGERFKDKMLKSRDEIRRSRPFNDAISHLSLRPKGEYLIEDDISNGRENFKIPALSYKRNDHAPDDYLYVTEHIQYNDIHVNTSLSNMSSCECVGECKDGTCYCSSNHVKGRCYDSKGRLNANYNMESPEIIYECNAGCRCNPRCCKNLVIQGGNKSKLALFRTKSRGWGIKTLENLKKGTFIGVYSGELITASSSYSRSDDTYLFNLASVHIYQQSQSENTNPESTKNVLAGQEQTEATVIDDTSKQNDVPQGEDTAQDSLDKEQYVCDAKYYGNFTRFINHSCEPNIVGIRSFTKHQDSRFPYISFFANQDIATNAELTLNYGDNYWLVKCKRDGIYCLCKRSNCRFTKKTFQQTLRQYNRQKKIQRS